MMITLENEFLKVSAEELGAELTSVYDKAQNRECLWTADPQWWDKHAPLLFPVVGSCIGKEYRFEGKTYPMPQHGFCKDAVFSVEEKTETKVVFVYQSPIKSYSFTKLKIDPKFYADKKLGHTEK